MIASSGLVELSSFVTDGTTKLRYLAAATNALESASEKYLESPAESYAVVRNATGSYPQPSLPIVFGVSCQCAFPLVNNTGRLCTVNMQSHYYCCHHYLQDYYFLEAFIRVVWPDKAY